MQHKIANFSSNFFKKLIQGSILSSLASKASLSLLSGSILLSSILLSSILLNSIVRAECTSLKKGPVVFDVFGCAAINPEKFFEPAKEKYRWVHELDAVGKKAFFDSYRGLYLKGKIVKSDAIQAGVTTDKGALIGETIFAFMPPGSSQCPNLNGKRFSGQLVEVCCDGSGDVPCMLNTSYVLTNPQPIGAVASGAGDITKQKSKASKDYQAGERAFNEHKYKDAIRLFGAARTKGELDLPGYYKIGFAFRELDQCADAIPFLRHIYDLNEKNAIWADDEVTAREAGFLLARCYAKQNDPGSAVMILNSYLLEPSKYMKEIRDSLIHKDFGWIHTSRDYRKYKATAQQKVGASKTSP